MKLAFRNPAFFDGQPNVTCRKASPKYKALALGSEVELTDLEGNRVGSGRVSALALYDSVLDIPTFFLDNEHDLSCTSAIGLLIEMVRVYKDFGGFMPEDDSIVVIEFWLQS